MTTTSDLPRGLVGWVALLAVVLLAACGSDEVSNDDTSTTTTTTAAGSDTDTSWFEVAAVVAPAPCSSEATPSLDDPTCYELGEPVFDAAGVADASAVEDEPSCEIPPGESMCIVTGPTSSMASPGTWSVYFSVNDDALQAFNALAGECFNRSTTCPTGQVAIVVDGEIVSAPIIQQPEYERDAFAISAELDQEAAQGIAERLSA